MADVADCPWALRQILKVQFVGDSEGEPDGPNG